MDGLTMEQIISLIGSLGFPIVMCLYMTVSFNKTLSMLCDTVLSLSVKIDTLIDTLTEKGDSEK